MRYGRVSTSTLGRIVALGVGSLALLVAIFLLLPVGASRVTVLAAVGANAAPIAIAGLGMTAIIFTGGIDLSIGSMIAVAGAVFGALVHHGMPPSVCFAACLLATWMLAVTNGLLVRWLGISAIIVTLGGLAVYRGLALVIADMSIAGFGGNISVPDDAYHGPGKFYSLWIFGAVIVVSIVWSHAARGPREWLAVGCNREACRLQGMNPDRIAVTAFAVAGVFFAIAALLKVTNVQAIEPARLALGFELSVIGAVVLGGTNIFGGEGTFAGTLLGAIFLELTSQLLQYARVDPYWQDVMIGFTIVTVIGFDCWLHRGRIRVEELA